MYFGRDFVWFERGKLIVLVISLMANGWFVTNMLRGGSAPRILPTTRAAVPPTYHSTPEEDFGPLVKAEVLEVRTGMVDHGSPWGGPDLREACTFLARVQGQGILVRFIIDQSEPEFSRCQHLKQGADTFLRDGGHRRYLWDRRSLVADLPEGRVQ